MKHWLCLILTALFLSGCASAAADTVPTTLPLETTAVTMPTITQEAVALQEAPAPALPVILECTAPGILEQRCDTAVVDYSNASQGYVMVCYTGQTDRRLKVRITRSGTTYTYNLTPEEWTVFPLSDGSGSYQATVYKNTGGTKYAVVMSATFDVTLEDEFAPFLRPNQYVNYTDSPDTMALGTTLCTGWDHPLEKVAAVYDYVVANLSYDYDKAKTVKSGYLPVLDAVLAAKKGICFDYAALMTAMLRSQQVPCKLVVGYAGSTYHAWISVWTEENGWVDGAIFFDGHTWKRMDPTFASTQQSSAEILDFIENGDYRVKYLY